MLIESYKEPTIELTDPINKTPAANNPIMFKKKLLTPIIEPTTPNMSSKTPKVPLPTTLMVPEEGLQPHRFKTPLLQIG